jgi:HrpA-like RNA helicase
MISRVDLKKINYDLIHHLILFICKSRPAGDFTNNGSILVFLPGVYEISKMHELISENENFHVLELHGNLSNSQQSRVFKKAPLDKVKVVLSTNVAETGITIPDVVYVIDSMRQREVRYDQKRNIKRLCDVFCSKANQKQRSGRAGRVQPGYSYHLIPIRQFEKLVLLFLISHTKGHPKLLDCRLNKLH